LTSKAFVHLTRRTVYTRLSNGERDYLWLGLERGFRAALELDSRGGCRYMFEMDSWG
jgi:hypothetical protein